MYTFRQYAIIICMQPLTPNMPSVKKQFVKLAQLPGSIHQSEFQRGESGGGCG